MQGLRAVMEVATHVTCAPRPVGRLVATHGTEAGMQELHGGKEAASETHGIHVARALMAVGHQVVSNDETRAMGAASEAQLTHVTGAPRPVGGPVATRGTEAGMQELHGGTEAASEARALMAVGYQVV